MADGWGLGFLALGAANGGCGGFLKWGYPPVIIHLAEIFHYKPSIFGDPLMETSRWIDHEITQRGSEDLKPGNRIGHVICRHIILETLLRETVLETM